MMKRLMIAILFGLLPATSAWAEQASSGFYFSLAGGSFRTEANAPLPGVNDDRSIGGFAELGLDLAPFIGANVRVGALDTADLFNDTATFNTDIFISYFAKPQIPVGDRFRIYGLVGFTHLNSTVNGSIVSDGWRNDFSYGGGLEAAITDSIWIGGDWVRYLDDEEINPGILTSMDGVAGRLIFHY